MSHNSPAKQLSLCRHSKDMSHPDGKATFGPLKMLERLLRTAAPLSPDKLIGPELQRAAALMCTHAGPLRVWWAFEEATSLKRFIRLKTFTSNEAGMARREKNATEAMGDSSHPPASRSALSSSPLSSSPLSWEESAA